MAALYGIVDCRSRMLQQKAGKARRCAERQELKARAADYSPRLPPSTGSLEGQQTTSDITSSRRSKLPTMLQWYEDFLLHNISQVTGVESSLRSLTYFLPGRFPDAELAGEAIYSALNLLGLYHDSILVRLVASHSTHRGLRPGTTASTAAAARKAAAVMGSQSGLGAGPSASTSSLPASQGAKLQYTPSEHARYTRHFGDTSAAYNVAARALVVIGYFELLAEMLARRRLGEKRAWDAVVGIESVKAALRLALVHLSHERMLVQPPIPEREVDPAMLEEERKAAVSALAATQANDPGALPQGAPQPDLWRGARTGLTRPTLSSIRQRQHGDALEVPGRHGPGSARRHPLTQRSLGGSSSPSRDASGSGSGSDSDETLVDSFTEKDVNDYLLSRTLTPNDVKRPDELVRQLKSGVGYTAELVWILRPLVYVLALRRWGRKRKTPFAISMGLELLARLLRKRALAPRNADGTQQSLFSNPLLMAMIGGGDTSALGLMAGLLGGGGNKEARPVSEVEKGEWERRNRAFWWYLLRGPMWHSFTRPRLERIVSATEKRPLLGLLGGIVGDYLPLVDEYYYYSAT